MYFIHLINADKSSKWRAFCHWPADLTAFIDQTKWVIAKPLLYFIPKKTSQRGELSQRNYLED